MEQAKLHLVAHDRLRVQVNDVEQLGEGGRVVLVADGNCLGKSFVRETDIQQVTVVLNYLEDDSMRAYPSMRLNDANERYSVMIVEHMTPAQLGQIRAILEA